MRELRDEPEPGLCDLLARLSPVDLVIVEGFKRDPHPKIEIHRPELGKPSLYPDDDWIVAIASPLPVPGAPVPCLPLNDPHAIADFILALPT
jgi:molybdopterin-guanine dinucleotide biosynthesis protein MobB